MTPHLQLNKWLNKSINKRIQILFLFDFKCCTKYPIFLSELVQAPSNKGSALTCNCICLDQQSCWRT